MSKKKDTLKLDEMCIILRIPENAVGLTVKAAIAVDNDIVKVKKKLDYDDIQDARTAFLDNVEDGDDFDAHFVLTDEAKSYLESLKGDQ